MRATDRNVGESLRQWSRVTRGDIWGSWGVEARAVSGQWISCARATPLSCVHHVQSQWCSLRVFAAGIGERAEL